MGKHNEVWGLNTKVHSSYDAIFNTAVLQYVVRRNYKLQGSCHNVSRWNICAALW